MIPIFIRRKTNSILPFIALNTLRPASSSLKSCFPFPVSIVLKKNFTIYTFHFPQSIV